MNLTSPDAVERPGRRLVRDYFGLHRLEWSDDQSVNFYLGYGDWIRLFRANGLEVERLVEIQAPADAKQHRHDDAARPGLGAPLAVRGDLGGAQARAVSVPPAPPLLLASVSPQRRAILEQLRIPFDVVAPAYYEEAAHRPGRARTTHALGKARSVADGGERPVLGVDTAVVSTGGPRQAGRTASEAERMLEAALRAERTRSSPASACSPRLGGGGA